MIKLEEVSLSFGKKKVLDNFSLRIENGEKVAITGHSGSGKTSLLRVIMGLEKPQKGTVKVDGRISAVFQENRLFENFSALENVVAVCDDREKGEKLLNEMFIGDSINKLPSELSGGMARRVALARALAYDHDILILDEPFTGIDNDTKEKLIEYINKFVDETGKTLVLVSHDENECRKLCNRFLT